METPLGEIYLSVDREGALRSLDWHEDGRDYYYSLNRYYRDIECVKRAMPIDLRTLLQDYFAGNLNAIDNIEISLPGTDFQKSVWAALCEVPVGQTCSYGDIANKLENPGAMRAVGMANNANPIALVVPCHRVIGADGKMVGYGSGVTRKEWLLRHEGALATQGSFEF